MKEPLVDGPSASSGVDYVESMESEWTFGTTDGTLCLTSRSQAGELNQPEYLEDSSRWYRTLNLISHILE